jgi:hypothetical protein
LDSYQAYLRFSIKCFNAGRGIAHDIFFNVEANFGNTTLVGIRPSGIIKDSWEDTTVDGAITVTMTTPDVRLPPGSSRDFFELAFLIKEEPSKDITVNITCGAGNSPGAARELRFPWDILLEAYKHLNTNYPNNLSKQDGERQVDSLISVCID